PRHHPHLPSFPTRRSSDLVDLVIQYMSPRQVNSLVQRVGRSGHTLTRTSKGILVAVSTEDLLESVAVIELAQEGRIEPTKVPVRSEEHTSELQSPDHLVCR